MKIELKPLIDSPLTEDEEAQFSEVFDQLKADPSQKIVVTLASSDKPLHARRKLAYMAQQKSMQVTIKKVGDQVIATTTKSVVKKRPRLNREQVTEKVSAFLKTQPGKPLTRIEIATGAGLTARQIGNALTDLNQKGCLRIEGGRGNERITFLVNGAQDEPEKDRRS